MRTSPAACPIRSDNWNTCAPRCGPRRHGIFPRTPRSDGRSRFSVREATSIASGNAVIATRNAIPTEAEFESLLDQIFAESQAFPCSTERETGAFLANLIRLLRPRQVLELGTFKGATTIQLIRALPFAGEPRVVTVDCVDVRSPALRKLDAFYSFVRGQDIDLVPTLGASFDFIYLDTLHTYEHTKAQVAVIRAHHPAAVMAAHDVLSHAGVA